jgi:hypothetical protein
MPFPTRAQQVGLLMLLGLALAFVMMRVLGVR